MNPLEEYISLIHYWQQNPCKVKGEEHHIIPQSLGGCNKAWNKVKLPTLDHIECHRLLTLIYATGEEHFRMCAAYALMCTSRSRVKVSEEEAAEARRLSSESRKGRPNKNKGKHIIPEESRLAIGNANRGRHPSEETRRKMADAHKGKSNPGRKGKAPWNKGIPSSIPHDPTTGRFTKRNNS